MGTTKDFVDGKHLLYHKCDNCGITYDTQKFKTMEDCFYAAQWAESEPMYCETCGPITD